MKYATFLAAGVLLSADVLVWFGHIDGAAWAATVTATVVALFAANVWSKT